MQDQCISQDILQNNKCCECKGNTLYNGTTCVKAALCTCIDSIGNSKCNFKLLQVLSTMLIYITEIKILNGN